MPMREVTNAGVLFKNDKRENEKQPTHTGKLNVNGTEYRLAAWVKEGQNGKYFSLKVSLPQERNEPRQQTRQEKIDDEIPW